MYIQLVRKHHCRNRQSACPKRLYYLEDQDQSRVTNAYKTTKHIKQFRYYANMKCLSLLCQAPDSFLVYNTVEPVLKDHPIGHQNMVSQNRWSLVTGSFTLQCRTFCQKTGGPLRQVDFHGSGLSRQVSLDLH